jgi:hypothetical protein
MRDFRWIKGGAAQYQDGDCYRCFALGRLVGHRNRFLETPNRLRLVDRFGLFPGTKRSPRVKNPLCSRRSIVFVETRRRCATSSLVSQS